MKMNRRSFFGTATVAIAGMGSGAKPAKRPNILLIVADDITDDLLGCYGGQVLTPTIDRLASQGMKFSQAYSTSSVCTPSRYSLQTGAFAGRSTDRWFLKENNPDQPYTIHFNVSIHEGTPTLAKALRAGGYYTGFSGKWHIAPFIKEMGLEPFNPADDPNDPAIDAKLRYHQAVAVAEIKKSGGYEYAASIYIENSEIGYMPKGVRFHNMEWITQGALGFFDAWDGKRPFFLSYNSTVRHGPSHQKSMEQDPRQTIGGKLDKAPEVQRPRESIFQRLEAAGLKADFNTTGMLWLDDALEAIFQRLEKTGEMDNTLIFFCSDNGNEPGKSTCYERGIRLPMIMKFPGKVAADSRCNALVSNIDVVPTILDAAGFKPPAGMPLDGTSLLPLITGETDKLHDEVFIEFGFSRAVTDGKWKYTAVRYPQDILDGMKSGALDMAPNLFNDFRMDQAPITLSGYPQMFEADQLYDLHRDPEEQSNLANNPEHAVRLAKMKQTLSSYTATFAHPFPVEADKFQSSERFKELVEETRKRIPVPNWWKGKKESTK
jgi:arylsulfatase A-like enzyme